MRTRLETTARCLTLQPVKSRAVTAELDGTRAVEIAVMKLRSVARSSSICIIVTMTTVITNVAVADDGPFYCGSKIIDVGMTQSDVLTYCGPPASRSTDEQEVRGPNNRILGINHVHKWKYESYSATRMLTFVEDKLQSIERW